MSGSGIRNVTTRRLARLRLPAARITGPALALMLTVIAAAAPAQAATATVTAGATWSQLMHRKLNLGAESAGLAALLPGLRATVTTRTSDLAQAQKTQAAVATTLATVATADQTARSRYATASTAAATARKAVTAAQQRRPRNSSHITRAKRALTVANTTVRARSATVEQTASALKAAQRVYATATNHVATATAGYRLATKVLGDTQQKITSLPKLNSALATQAAAISNQVVAETRATFTIAQTTQVYGITVNKIVAYPFQRMIDDAAKAGIQLSGGGFRTKQQQIALRITNGCPDIWTAPAWSCKVPTAIPGRSLHEIGLAIDMTSGKKTINNRGSAAFIWLAANAGKYGFVNLPSEPWHWSITGS